MRLIPASLTAIWIVLKVAFSRVKSIRRGLLRHLFIPIILWDDQWSICSGLLGVVGVTSPEPEFACAVFYPTLFIWQNVAFCISCFSSSRAIVFPWRAACYWCVRLFKLFRVTGDWACWSASCIFYCIYCAACCCTGAMICVPTWPMAYIWICGGMPMLLTVSTATFGFMCSRCFWSSSGCYGSFGIVDWGWIAAGYMSYPSGYGI